MIPYRSRLAAATFSLSVLLYVDRACISTAKEPMSAALGLNDQDWGWVMSAFAFGYALLQTPTGMLADRCGARRMIAIFVCFWSIFTGLTAAAWNWTSLVIIRFLFGAGEAGAFPAVARVVYSWFPVAERGLVKGINFSGSRIGAALAMPLVPAMFDYFGWRGAFGLLMAIGVAWAIGWHLWFRDDPTEMPGLPATERDYILASRQSAASQNEAGPPPFRQMFGSANYWAILAQYFCSNFTFFFCLTWLYPYIKKTYSLDSVDAGLYAMLPLYAGAMGNVAAGRLVDELYEAGRWRMSRRLPAVVGFVLAAVGLLMGARQETAGGAIAWLSLAIFGADMTLSPSWSICVDLGGRHAGAVSGTMNMAGNLGSALVGVAFPQLVATHGAQSFFYVGAALNLFAATAWLTIRPDRSFESPPARMDR